MQKKIKNAHCAQKHNLKHTTYTAHKNTCTNGMQIGVIQLNY